MWAFLASADPLISCRQIVSHVLSPFLDGNTLCFLIFLADLGTESPNLLLDLKEEIRGGGIRGIQVELFAKTVDFSVSWSVGEELMQPSQFGQTVAAFPFLHGSQASGVSAAHPHMLGRCISGLDHSAALEPFEKFDRVVDSLIQSQCLGRVIKHVVHCFEEGFPFEVDVRVGRVQ